MVNQEFIRNVVINYVGIVGSIASTIALLETKKLKDWMPWLLAGGLIMAIALATQQK